MGVEVGRDERQQVRHKEMMKVRGQTAAILLFTSAAERREGHMFQGCSSGSSGSSCDGSAEGGC